MGTIDEWNVYLKWPLIFLQTFRPFGKCDCLMLVFCQLVSRFGSLCKDSLETNVGSTDNISTHKRTLFKVVGL